MFCFGSKESKKSGFNSTQEGLHLVCGCGKPDCTLCQVQKLPAGCSWPDCKVCEWEPEFAIPYWSGQWSVLENVVLKDLWQTIRLVKDSNSIHDPDVTKSAQELFAKLSACPITRYYLDQVHGSGWSVDLLQQAKSKISSPCYICFRYLPWCICAKARRSA